VTLCLFGKNLVWFTDFLAVFGSVFRPLIPPSQPKSLLFNFRALRNPANLAIFPHPAPYPGFHPISPKVTHLTQKSAEGHHPGFDLLTGGRPLLTLIFKELPLLAPEDKRSLAPLHGRIKCEKYDMRQRVDDLTSTTSEEVDGGAAGTHPYEIAIYYDI